MAIKPELRMECLKLAHELAIKTPNEYADLFARTYNQMIQLLSSDDRVTVNIIKEVSPHED
jgi:hypothetical protein